LGVCVPDLLNQLLGGIVTLGGCGYLILWVGLVVWHLPLMIIGEIHWSDVVFLLGFVIVFNWVFNYANGSVLIIMLMHAMNNTISGSFIGPMFSGADSVRQS
jgi:hypothetical protein